MNKLFCLFALLITTFCGNGQDTSHIKFRPGTLVGKYYGTYDTSAKKPVEVVNTKRASELQVAPVQPKSTIANQSLSDNPQLQVNKNNDDLLKTYSTKQASQLQVSSSPGQNEVTNKSLSAQPQLQINKNNDLLDIYSTEQASQLQVNSVQPQSDVSNQSLSNQTPVQVNRNYVPAGNTVNSGPPTPIYRDTRLGSSSPLYKTYKTNDNGAGSVTTSDKSGGGAVQPVYSDLSIENQTPQYTPPVYRETRLGSSTPQYDTYKKNDNGTGAVTTSDKSGGGSMQPVYSEMTVNPLQQQPPHIYRDTRLGSSTTQYDTYKKNDNGAGAVTTSDKSGGGSIPSDVTEFYAPNQGPEKPGEHIYRDTRLGSSSPQNDTYKTNDNGAGSVTTNPNKWGGGTPIFIEPIKPEQYQQDSTNIPKPEIKNMEKRGN